MYESYCVKFLAVFLLVVVVFVGDMHLVPPRWRRGRAFASCAGDRGSIPSPDRPKSKNR